MLCFESERMLKLLPLIDKDSVFNQRPNTLYTMVEKKTLHLIVCHTRLLPYTNTLNESAHSSLWHNPDPEIHSFSALYLVLRVCVHVPG